MASVQLDIYSVFLDRVFIRGRILPGERPVAEALVHVGGGNWSRMTSLSEADGSFYDVLPFAEEHRAELFPARLMLRFVDGEEQLIENATKDILGATNFWVPLHPVLDGMRKRGSGRFLEVGSRARSGISRRTMFTPDGWEYVGFDVLAGENVDVVGDAHEISNYFPPEHFDAVGALAVLEHILMPWKVAIELNKVMKPGAVGFFVTHQTYPVHDQPWDFWRYSDSAWDGILNRATGFEIVDSKMSEPAFIVSKICHAAVDHTERYVGYQASVVVFRKIGPTELSWDVKLQDITSTRYPAGELPLIAR